MLCKEFSEGGRETCDSVCAPAVWRVLHYCVENITAPVTGRQRLRSYNINRDWRVGKGNIMQINRERTRDLMVVQNFYFGLKVILRGYFLSYTYYSKHTVERRDSVLH